MLPAALATGIGSDVQRGLGVVIVGGLITTTLLTIFMLPAFYFVSERRAVRRASAAKARAVSGLSTADGTAPM
jgi:cobalt-zinc-cadmium resistance protein CzcA